MRRSVRWSVWLLAVLALSSAVACSSKEATTNPKMSNDEAVSLLEQQGYTAEAAQCLIDGATQQNVDIFTFLASDQATHHDIEVVTSVGAYCAEHYGTTGTTVPGADTGTSVAVRLNASRHRDDVSRSVEVGPGRAATTLRSALAQRPRAAPRALLWSLQSPASCRGGPADGLATSR